MKKFFYNRAVPEKSGQILLFAMVFMAIMLVVSTTLAAVTGLHARAERHSVAGVSALKLAEAGVDKAIYELNINANFTGESDVALGDGTFSTVVTTIDTNNKQIVSTGRATAGGVATTKIVSAIAAINLDVVSFQFGVQAGYGGISMDNNSQINGNVFANAPVTGSGVITGDASVAAGSAAAPDQNFSVWNTNFLFGNTNARKDVAQSFVPSATNIITKVKVYLKKNGNPGNLTVHILTDDAGKPSKTVLATGSIAASTVTTNYAFIEGAFSTNPTLIGGQKYWLMVSSPINSNNYYNWGLDNADSYLSNTGKYSANYNASTPVWTNAGGDFDFQTIMGGIPTYLSGVTVNGTARAPAITSCNIGGSAYYQTTNTCSVAGSLYPGSIASAPQAMPISQAQITEWEQAAEAGGVVGNVVLDDSDIATLGPIKINGNLTITNNSTMWVSGPVWVTGNILLENNANVRASASLGNAGTMIIADNTTTPTVNGKIEIGNNTVIAGNGNPGNYIMLISNYAGTDAAINVNNNVSGTIYYAPNGMIDVFNNATPIQLTANLIHLNNNAVINYQTGLQSALFSSGPGGSWAFKSGTYVVAK